MKWILVVIVMNVPVKTDLTFNNLNECLSAEQAMRTEWLTVFNEAKKSGTEQERAGYISSQMTKGTCIPTK
jgi:hypothetical protein